MSSSNVAPPIGTSWPQNVTLAPVVRRYATSVIIVGGSAAAVAVPPGTQCAGFAIMSLDSGITLQIKFGATGVLFPVEKGAFIKFDGCAPVNDGVYMETDAAVPATTLVIMWFLGNGAGVVYQP